MFYRLERTDCDGNAAVAACVFHRRRNKTAGVLLVLIHNLFSAIAFPFADPLGKGLRAAGDVKFTMLVSLGTTLGGRLIFSFLFGIGLQLGIIGIAYAMCLDWVLRGVIFWRRFRKHRWKQCKVI